MKKNLLIISAILWLFSVTIITTSCKKKSDDNPPDPPPSDQTVTDADGNVYTIIEIGSQKWMKENLKTTKYRDGSSIPNLTNDAAWTGSTSGAWCYYENEASNNDPYGKLYNYYAVQDPRNLAPAGWHVATESDINTLISFLGGETVAGGKLKESGTTHWATPNTGANNSSGFTAMPGGNRFNNGSFYQKNSEGSFWISSSGTGDPKYLYLTFNSGQSFVYTNLKKLGYSVRCVKD